MGLKKKAIKQFKNIQEEVEGKQKEGLALLSTKFDTIIDNQNQQMKALASIYQQVISNAEQIKAKKPKPIINMAIEK